LLVGPRRERAGRRQWLQSGSSIHAPFNLYVRDLHERQREAISSIFEEPRKLAPCILVFEDIDGFVNDNNRAVFLNQRNGQRFSKQRRPAGYRFFQSSQKRLMKRY